MQPAVFTSIPGLSTRERSFIAHQEALYALAINEQGQLQLAVSVPMATHLEGFEGQRFTLEEQTLASGPLSPRNAAWLRAQLDWLRPKCLGLSTSVGLGDRLGLATPGHLRAVNAVGGTLAPIPAQQSIREMTRTGRSPQQVMDDAMWGVFAEGWRGGFGADADHLKTPEDIDRCLEAGYTFYTFDPGQYVDDSALDLSFAALQERLEQLPWEQLEDRSDDFLARYRNLTFACEEHKIVFTPHTLAQAAVKYGRAVAHVTHLYRHLARVGAGKSWEVEVSVDETAWPTTAAEHVYLVTELRRLGVQWVSLAPRFIGRFEKGVDYLGDIQAFEADIAVHAAIARTLGPYKISLHSGSDKFSIYTPAMRQTRGLVHLKTAGTSYLEALRTVATLDPDFMRSLYAFACAHYTEDRASYHVSAELSQAPAPETLTDAMVQLLLEQFATREILHVTFGSVLTARDAHGKWRFYEHLMELLRIHEEAYAANLQNHFVRHLQPFVAS